MPIKIHSLYTTSTTIFQHTNSIMPLYGSDNDLQHDKKRRDREAVTGDNKKKNRRDPSYDNVQKAILPMDIWERILCFLGVPDLGRCALVSKEMSAIAKNDVLWKHHVIKLRETAFGDFRKPRS